MIKNIRKNEKVIKAMAAGLAMMITVTSTPVDVLAVENENETANNTIEETQGTEETQTSANESVVNEISTVENELESVFDGGNNTESGSENNTESTTESTSENTTENSTENVAVNVVDALSDLNEAVEDISDDSNYKDEKVVEAVTNVNTYVENAKTDVFAAADAAREAGDAVSSAIDTNKTYSDIENEAKNELVADIEELVAEKEAAVENALENIKGASTIEEAQQISEEAKAELDAARQEYEEKKAAYEEAVNNAKEALDASYSVDKERFDAEKEKAAKELKEAAEQLAKAKEEADSIQSQIDEAIEISDALEKYANKANEYWKIYEELNEGAKEVSKEVEATDYYKLFQAAKDNEGKAVKNSISKDADLVVAVEAYNAKNSTSYTVDEIKSMKAVYDAAFNKRAAVYTDNSAATKAQGSNNKIFNALYNFTSEMIKFDLISSGEYAASVDMRMEIITSDKKTDNYIWVLDEETGKYKKLEFNKFVSDSANGIYRDGFNNMKMLAIYENEGDETPIGVKYFMFEVFNKDNESAPIASNSNRSANNWKQDTVRVVGVEYTQAEVLSIVNNEDGNRKGYENLSDMSKESNPKNAANNTQLRTDKVNGTKIVDTKNNKTGFELREGCYDVYGTDSSLDAVLIDLNYGKYANENVRWDSIYSAYNSTGRSEELVAKLDAYNQLKEKAETTAKAVKEAEEKVTELKNKVSVLEFVEKITDSAEYKAKIAILENELDMASEKLSELEGRKAEIDEALNKKVAELTPAPKHTQSSVNNGGNSEESGIENNSVALVSESIATESTPQTIQLSAPTVAQAVAGIRSLPVSVFNGNANTVEEEKHAADGNIENDGNMEGIAVSQNKRINDKDEAAKSEIKSIADEEVPLAAFPVDKENKIDWWWLLILLFLGETGRRMYKHHKEKMEKTA